MYACKGWFFRRRVTPDGRFRIARKTDKKENAEEMEKSKEIFAIYKIV